LPGFSIDDRAERFLFELARAHTLRALRYCRCLVPERIVIGMMRAGIFGQFNVSSGSAQAFDVGPARSHRYVIIRSSMEHPNGNGTDIDITNKCSLTRGIERNVRGEVYSRTPGLLKSLEAGVEC